MLMSLQVYFNVLYVGPTAWWYTMGLLMGPLARQFQAKNVCSLSNLWENRGLEGQWPWIHHELTPLCGEVYVLNHQELIPLCWSKTKTNQSLCSGVLILDELKFLGTVQSWLIIFDINGLNWITAKTNHETTPKYINRFYKFFHHL